MNEGESSMTKRASLLTLLTALLIGLGLLAPNNANAAGEPYTIANHYTGMVVDVWQGSIANTHTVLWPYWGGANQQFDLVYVDQKYFQMKVRHAGKCLDVNNASADDGAIVQTFDCHGGPSQLWFTQMVTDPYVQCQPNMFCDNARMTIRAKHSGKCLDARNGGPSLANRPKQGAYIQQWTCFNNLNQFWDLNGGPPPPVH
jgi:Ricin-type beta-trefoil lectin domain-like